MSTYTPIASQTISSATVGVTFAGIPQYYTDLVLVVNGNTSAGPTDNNMRFNDDAGSNYGATMLFGQGTSSGSALTTAANLEVGGIYWASGRGSRTVHIMNYANPNVFKNVLSQASSDTQVNFRAGTWRNTEPITSIYVFVGASTYVAGTTFNLYGIQEGGGYALGGDIVTTDGTYWYHTFLSSGAFIPNKDLTVDYLIVAGGGAGGGITNESAGGGGAGGYRLLSNQTNLESTNYRITVGAGGAGTPGGSGGNGTNSSVIGGAISLSSTGGGGGGGTYNGAGGNGGSGGGSYNVSGGAGNAGGYSPVEGFAGGHPYGGGGGAGGVGAYLVAGNGSNSASSWASATGTGVGGYYAGGGSPGQTSTSSLGGGGRGEAPLNNNNQQPGATNTGSGGGGRWNSGSNTFGAAGGSGIVIVRYAV